MKTDTTVFLRTPEKAKLHAGKVSAISAKGFTISFEVQSFQLEEGAEVIAYYEVNRRFMQQPVRVLSVVRTEEGGLSMELETTGDPVSAESRECYRVSCYASGIKAQLGEDPELCEVLDMSATGFAVFSTAKYEVGQTLQATLYHDGESIPGTIVVQSAREYGKNLRYGLRAIDDKRKNATLKSALGRVSLAVQRAQAARLSGNL